MTIATDEKFRAVFAVSANSSLIVMTLDALHYAKSQARV